MCIFTASGWVTRTKWTGRWAVGAVGEADPFRLDLEPAFPDLGLRALTPHIHTHMIHIHMRNMCVSVCSAYRQLHVDEHGK